MKVDIYTDYGGQSINLDQFWKAFDKGMPYEQAAFETFAGEQAKKFALVYKGEIVAQGSRYDKVYQKFCRILEK